MNSLFVKSKILYNNLRNAKQTQDDINVMSDIGGQISTLIKYTNDSEFANLFLLSLKIEGISIYENDNIFYIYNRELRIYDKYDKKNDEKFIANIVEQGINELLKVEILRLRLQMLDNDNDDIGKHRIDKIDNLIKKIGNTSQITSILTKLKRIYFNENIEFDKDREFLHFKNGKLNMKNGEFSERTGKEMCTYCLPYDFNDNDKVKNLCKEVKELFFKCFNNTIHDYNTMMSVLAYELTGVNKFQIFLYMLGTGASNGKSTIFKILCSVFKKYCMKVSTEFLEKDNKDRFRELSLIESQVRIAYAEEVEKEIDKAFLKQFCSGDEEISFKELYNSKNKKTIIHCTLNVLSNTSPLFYMDNGIKRRGRQFDVKSQFYNKEKFPSNPKNTDFIKDLNLLNKFDSDDYKNALILLFIPFWIDYFKTEKIYGIEQLEDNFLSSASINDTFGQFLSDHFIITKDSTDRIGRLEFMELYNLVFKTKKEFKYIISDIRTAGLIYDKQLRSPFDGKFGCILGLRFIEDVKRKNKPDLTFGDSFITNDDVVHEYVNNKPPTVEIIEKNLSQYTDEEISLLIVKLKREQNKRQLKKNVIKEMKMNIDVFNEETSKIDFNVNNVKKEISQINKVNKQCDDKYNVTKEKMSVKPKSKPIQKQIDDEFMKDFEAEPTEKEMIVKPKQNKKQKDLNDDIQWLKENDHEYIFKETQRCYLNKKLLKCPRCEKMKQLIFETDFEGCSHETKCIDCVKKYHDKMRETIRQRVQQTQKELTMLKPKTTTIKIQKTVQVNNNEMTDLNKQLNSMLFNDY